MDLRNQNQASLKDNFAMPNMDHILQTVATFEMMSLLVDGFLGYNQISVSLEYQQKISFTTPWGTFEYNRMPFGLINVGATFQRTMNSSFKHLINKVIVIFLDDMMVFSKRRKKYLHDLRSHAEM